MEVVRPGIEIVSRDMIIHVGGDQRVGCPLLHSNFCPYRDESFAASLMNEYNPRIFKHQAVRLGKYSPDTLLDTKQGYLVVSGPFVVREQVSPWLQEISAAVSETRNWSRGALEISTQSLLASRIGETTWGHWLFEMLPKILIAENTYPGFFSFIVPRHIVEITSGRTYSTSIIESLAAYGISYERLIPVGDFRIYRFGNVSDIFGLHDRNIPHLLALDVLRSIKVPDAPKAKGRKIAVLRPFGGRRSLFNYDAIKKLLLHRNYEVFNLGAISFREQVALFRSAEVIVGELGSDLAGLAFVQRGTKLVTLGPLNWSDTYFIPVMQMLDLHVADVRGVSVRITPRDELTDNGPANSFYVIPPAELDVALDAIESVDVLRGRISAKIIGKEHPYRLGKKLAQNDFGLFSTSSPLASEGLLAAEADLQWSTGDGAWVAIKPFNPRTEQVWLEVRGLGFVVPPRYLFKDVSVSINDCHVGTFSLRGSCHEFFLVPSGLLKNKEREIRIGFYHLSWPSPRSLGVSADERALGIGLKSVAFYETTFYTTPESGPTALSSASTGLSFTDSQVHMSSDDETAATFTDGAR